MNRFALLVSVFGCGLVVAACGGANPEAIGTPSGVAPGQPPIDSGEGPGSRPEGAAQPQGDTANSPNKPPPPPKPSPDQAN